MLVHDLLILSLSDVLNVVLRFRLERARDFLQLKGIEVNGGIISPTSDGYQEKTSKVSFNQLPCDLLQISYFIALYFIADIHISASRSNVQISRQNF